MHSQWKCINVPRDRCTFPLRLQRSRKSRSDVPSPCSSNAAFFVSHSGERFIAARAGLGSKSFANWCKRPVTDLPTTWPSNVSVWDGSSKWILASWANGIDLKHKQGKLPILWLVLMNVFHARGRWYDGLSDRSETNREKQPGIGLPVSIDHVEDRFVS